MDAFFAWLFNTRQGVIVLIVGAILVFLIIAFVLERGTKSQFYNHEPETDDDESGWSFFDDDNV